MKHFLLILFLLQGCTEEPKEDVFVTPQCYTKQVCERPWVQEILVDTIDSAEEHNPVYYIQPGRHFTYGRTHFYITLSCDKGAVGFILEGTTANVAPKDYYHPNTPEHLKYDLITSEVFEKPAISTGETCYKYVIKETDRLGAYTFVRFVFFPKAEGTGDFKVEYTEYGKYVKCEDVLHCPGES